MPLTPKLMAASAAAILACLAAGSAPLAASSVDPAIPAYQPQTVPAPKGPGYVLPDGSIQIVAYDEMKGIVSSLNALFLKSHPDFRFQTGTANNLATIYCLTFDATAFAALSWEVPGGLAYAAYVHGEPFGIRIAHASLNPEAKVSPLAVIVNPANPLKTIRADQVAHIFTEGGRKRDLDHWNQLGLKAPWADREIHPCGLPWSDQYRTEDTGFPDLFAKMMGGNQPVWNYNAKSSYAAVVRTVAADPGAIGLAALNRLTPGVRVVAVSSNSWAKPTSGTEGEIVSGKYPYDRFLYLYVRRPSGKPLEPFLREYLRMVLTHEGQEAIAAESHGYLPLSSGEVRDELTKLD